MSSVIQLANENLNKTKNTNNKSHLTVFRCLICFFEDVSFIKKNILFFRKQWKSQLNIYITPIMCLHLNV